MGQIFYSTSNFVHHFIAIGEFKLELQSGNAQFRSKLMIFLSCLTLKIDGWPWKTRGYLYYATSSLVHQFVVIYELKLELQSVNAQICVKFVLTSVTLTFDFWLCADITSVSSKKNLRYNDWNIMKKVWQADSTFLRAAWSQLKIIHQVTISWKEIIAYFYP